MWDLALLGMVPGLRQAAPRDEPTLRAELREAVEWTAGPTVLRYPKTVIGPDVPAVRRVGDVDVLSEPSTADVDVLLISVGAMAGDVVGAAERLCGAGFSCRVVDPRWVTPVAAELIELARGARLVVTIEDGVVIGGVGSRIAQALRSAGVDVPTREIGVPVRFLDHGSVADVRARIGISAQDIARHVVEWAAAVIGGAGELDTTPRQSHDASD
jgi:1-deoxy-D-xylulose-5-phosphate synthase